MDGRRFKWALLLAAVLLFIAPSVLAGPCLLTVDVYSDGTGSVSDGSRSTRTVATWSYTCGATVTLTATPDPGYVLASWIWDDGATSLSNPLTFTLTSNRSILAYFNAQAAPGYVFSQGGDHIKTAGYGERVRITINLSNFVENLRMSLSDSKSVSVENFWYEFSRDWRTVIQGELPFNYSVVFSVDESVGGFPVTRSGSGSGRADSGSPVGWYFSDDPWVRGGNYTVIQGSYTVTAFQVRVVSDVNTGSSARSVSLSVWAEGRYRKYVPPPPGAPPPPPGQTPPQAYPRTFEVRIATAGVQVSVDDWHRWAGGGLQRGGSYTARGGEVLALYWWPPRGLPPDQAGQEEDWLISLLAPSPPDPRLKFYAWRFNATYCTWRAYYPSPSCSLVSSVVQGAASYSFYVYGLYSGYAQWEEASTYNLYWYRFDPVSRSYSFRDPDYQRSPSSGSVSWYRVEGSPDVWVEALFSDTWLEVAAAKLSGEEVSGRLARVNGSVVSVPHAVVLPRSFSAQLEANATLPGGSYPPPFLKWVVYDADTGAKLWESVSRSVTVSVQKGRRLRAVAVYDTSTYLYVYSTLPAAASVSTKFQQVSGSTPLNVSMPACSQAVVQLSRQPERWEVYSMEDYAYGGTLYAYQSVTASWAGGSASWTSQVIPEYPAPIGPGGTARRLFNVTLQVSPSYSGCGRVYRVCGSTQELVLQWCGSWPGATVTARNVDFTSCRVRLEATAPYVYGVSTTARLWLYGRRDVQLLSTSTGSSLQLTVPDRSPRLVVARIPQPPLLRSPASNSTFFLPGEGVPSPITPYFYRTPGTGMRGRWNITVSSPFLNLSSLADPRTWVMAAVVPPGGLVPEYVPLNGTWTVLMPRNWSEVAHLHVQPMKIVWWNQSTLANFPQVISGAPSRLRGGRLVGLAAWRPIFPEAEEAPAELKQPYNTAGVWLANGTTLAVYNVTFAHESGVRYWQPVVVTTLRIAGAQARYSLSGPEKYAERGYGRRVISMRLEVNVTWKYLPPAWLTQRWNLTLRAPSQELGVSLEAEGCSSGQCITSWSPTPSSTSSATLTFTLNLGDTEVFYSTPYPRGLGTADLPTARRFQLAARWWMPRSSNPSGQVYGSDTIAFTLAPASVVYLGWSGDNPQPVWDCFRQSSVEGVKPLGVLYRADLTVDWGDPTTGAFLGSAGTYLGVTPSFTSPYTVPQAINPKHWAAFYPLPAGGRYPITKDAVVPVPLVSKYPPRQA